MPTEPDNKPERPRPKIQRPRGKPVNDGFVVFEVDGFAQMTPEQRTWPVVTPEQMMGRVPWTPASPPETPPEAGGQPPPA